MGVKSSHSLCPYTDVGQLVRGGGETRVCLVPTDAIMLTGNAYTHNQLSVYYIAWAMCLEHIRMTMLSVPFLRFG